MNKKEKQENTENKKEKELEKQQVEEKTQEKQKTSEETKKEVIKDIEKTRGVSEETAKKEEEIAEKTAEESSATESEKPDKEPEENEGKNQEQEESEENKQEEKQTPQEIALAAWKPKTELGNKVKNGEVKNIDDILDNNKKILEPEIVDSLINVKYELIPIGQSKGKFGGGSRRAWRQTQRKTKEGNVPTFSAMAVMGDENGHVGIGVGRAMETLPARDKSIRKAKLNVIKVKRKCSAFDCTCDEEHSVPVKVRGKSGSVEVELIPAPQGIGLAAADNLKPILRLAGIKDVYTKTFGKKRTTFNLIKACFEALKKTNQK